MMFWETPLSLKALSSAAKIASGYGGVTLLLAAALFHAGCSTGLAQQAQDKLQEADGADPPSVAEPRPGKSTSGEAAMALELNKLEPQGDGCRAYMVLRNQSERHYQNFKLDLIEFRTDGVIGHRFAIDLGPIRPEKTLVKLFDIAGTACEEIGSFLINDIMECTAETGAIDDCFSGLSVSSRADADITK